MVRVKILDVRTRTGQTADGPRVVYDLVVERLDGSDVNPFVLGGEGALVEPADALRMVLATAAMSGLSSAPAAEEV